MAETAIVEAWHRLPVDDALLTVLARRMEPEQVRLAIRAGYVWVIAGPVDDERVAS